MYLINCDEETNKMKFIANIEKPKKKRRMLVGYVLGEPQATSKYTVKQLKMMGFVGLYRKDGAGEQTADTKV